MRPSLVVSLALVPFCGGIQSVAAQSRSVVDLCAGLGVTLPNLQPVTVLPTLNGLVGDINQHVVAPLSNTTLRVGVLDANGRVVSVASPGGCHLGASTLGLDTSRGITLGGGRMEGLGDLTAIPASAGDISAIAIGNGASTLAGVKEAVAIGSGSVAGVAGGVALGTGATADRAGLAGQAEAFSRIGVASANGALAVGAAGAERQIINLAGGTQPTDAVNLRQLSTVGSRLADGLGGGATFDAGTGAFTPPIFTIQGAPFTSVGGALGAIDTRLTGNATAIATNAAGLQSLQTQFASAPAGLVVQDAAARSLTLGAATDGASLNVAGTAGTRRIVGVASGTATNDAVNVGQLGAALAGVASGGNPAFAVDNRAGLAPALAAGMDGLALGYGAAAAGARSVAIGSGSVASQADTVSFGAAGRERRLVNVAAGTLSAGSSDAVTGGQLYATDQRVAANTTSITNLQSAVAAGPSGLVTQDTQVQSITIGAGTGSSLLSVSGTSGNRRIAGVASGVTANEAVNVAQLNTALGNLSVGGTSALSSMNDGGMSVALASGRDATAIGYGATVSAARAVALGNGSVADQANTVSIGAAGSERRLLNVAGGGVAAGSTEAVNGGQLYVLERAVAANSASLLSLQAGIPGGGTGGGNGGGTSFVAQNPISRLLTIGAGVDGGALSVANLSGASRTVEGVADAAIRAGSTQAVNGGQLAATNTRASATAAGLSQLSAGLGGGAAYNAAGNSFSGPEYRLRGGSYTDVGSALTALDAAIQTAGGTGSGVGSGAGSGATADDFPIRDNNTAGAAGPKATGANALASGHGARAVAADSQAMGGMALASGTGATSLGMRSAATGDRSIASGADSQASGSDSAAFGHGSLATADAATAIGTGTKATYAGATAIGAGARATADPTTAVGFEAEATGNEASAFGAYASATAQNATALGRSAAANGAGSSAIGVSARALGTDATALGHGAIAGQDNATAIGSGAATTRANQVAVGTRANTYTMAGLNSAESRAAQSGATRFVTADAAGNLALSDYDPRSAESGSVAGLRDQMSELSAQVGGIGQYAAETRREARQGIAAAMAMTAASMPSLPGRTSWTLNTATFRGEWAGGVALAHRLDTRLPIAVTAGFSYSQANRQGVRAGLAGEF